MSAWANARHTLGDSERWWERGECVDETVTGRLMRNKTKLEVKDVFLNRKPGNKCAKCS